MGKLIDLTGKRFGSLTVIERSRTAARGHGADARWTCRCDCGNVVEIDSYGLRHDMHPSCGCVNAKMTSERCITISVGDTFGRLTVIGRATPVGEKPVKWLCRCECGNTTAVQTYSLKSGLTTSCGCVRREQLSARNTSHGQSNTRLYNIWRGMKSRCNNPNDTIYKHYGAKGVSVCDEWMTDFMAFAEWSFAHGYNPDLPRNLCTIDRIDPSGNYCPDNCRWVDMSTQAKNKR